MTDDAPALAGMLRTVAVAGGAERELSVRHARKDGRSIVVLRAVDHGGSCMVEAQVSVDRRDGGQPGPYRFADAREALQFMADAVEALTYLGCDFQAD